MAVYDKLTYKEKDKLIEKIKAHLSKLKDRTIEKKEILDYLIKSKEKTDKYNKSLQDLFFEYKRDGLKKKQALKKAKRVLESFEGFK